MKKILIIVAVLAAAGVSAALVLPPSTWGQQAVAKEHKLPKNFGAYVLNVSDGRTMAISVSNELYSLRVKGITVPTQSDAALESELALRTLVFGRNILVENSVKGADGVYEGEVRVGPDHVAEAQVSNGLAAASNGFPDLAAMQETAKINKLGMWAPAAPADSGNPVLAAGEHPATAPTP